MHSLTQPVTLPDTQPASFSSPVYSFCFLPLQSFQILCHSPHCQQLLPSCFFYFLSCSPAMLSTQLFPIIYLFPLVFITLVSLSYSVRLSGLLAGSPVLPLLTLPCCLLSIFHLCLSSRFGTSALVCLIVSVFDFSLPQLCEFCLFPFTLFCPGSLCMTSACLLTNIKGCPAFRSTHPEKVSALVSA